MQTTYVTERLILTPLTLNDAPFSQQLVNTPGWLAFIGNRNVNNLSDAQAYVQRLLDNPMVNYWVVRTKSNELPLGVVTLLKKDYLEHPDIGFAFLPEHGKQGYAYEAAATLLNRIPKDFGHTQLLATVLPTNTDSIRLLTKLGFQFYREIQDDGERLLVYLVSVEE